MEKELKTLTVCALISAGLFIGLALAWAWMGGFTHMTETQIIITLYTGGMCVGIIVARALMINTKK